MKRYIVFCFLAALLPAAYAACITPTENMEIMETAVFCFGSYNVESGVNVANNNVIIDCNNSAIIGNSIGYGFLLKGRQNASIKGCNISGYEIGIYLDNANYSTISGNYLTKNKFGIASFNSFGNKISGNIMIENVNDEISYLQASLIHEDGAVELEKGKEAATPQEVMEEVISVKKPFLKQSEVLNEVNLIFSKYFNITQENLEISRTIFYNETDKSTRIIIHLKPKKVLLNVSLYEKIPKCVAAYANQLFFETGGYEVVQNDPLILWTFSRLDKEEGLSYKVFKNIGRDCEELLLSFGIATGFRDFEAAREERKNLPVFWIATVILAVLALHYIIRTSRRS